VNAAELALLRQRCDRGETFTAEEVEALLDHVESLEGDLVEASIYAESLEW
jgi:hypothetical protein